MIKKYKNLTETEKQKLNNSLLSFLLDLNFSDIDNYNDLLRLKHKISTNTFDNELNNLVENYIKEISNNEKR